MPPAPTCRSRPCATRATSSAQRWRRAEPGKRDCFGYAVCKRLQMSPLRPSATGAALAWQGDNGLNLKAVWARRIGTNPNPTASGNDQDGSLDKNRLWLSAGFPF